MSTDAWIEEHWIGEAVLPRPRRAPKLPALPVPHAPTCSRGNAALAAHAQSRDSAPHPGDGLSARQDGRNVVYQQARKLTQPLVLTPQPCQLVMFCGGQPSTLLLPAALLPVGLRNPVADRLRCRVELAGKVGRITSRANQIDHLSTKLR